jgi:hypothetical protein
MYRSHYLRVLAGIRERELARPYTRGIQIEVEFGDSGITSLCEAAEVTAVPITRTLFK